MGEEQSDAVEFNIDESNVSHQRWKHLIVKLINAISGKTRPLAFFMDEYVQIIMFLVFAKSQRRLILFSPCDID